MLQNKGIILQSYNRDLCKQVKELEKKVKKPIFIIALSLSTGKLLAEQVIKFC